MTMGIIQPYSEERYDIEPLVDRDLLPVQTVHEGWHNYVAQNSVCAMAVDPHTSRMWLATWGGVLSWNRDEGQSYRRYRSEHGLPGNAIAAICVEPSGIVWAAGREGGLAYFAGERWQRYDHMDPLKGRRVRALCAGGARDGVWAATDDGVYHIPSPGEQPTPIAGRPSDGAVDALVLLDDGHDLLLGNAWGLFRLRKGAEPQRIAPQQITSCTALSRDADGHVWAATPHALHFISDDLSAHRFQMEIGDGSSRIVAIAAGGRRVWALLTNGIAYHEQGQWAFVDRTGVENTAVHAIAASGDDAYLWLGTDRGPGGLRCAAGETPRYYLELLALKPIDNLNNICRSLAGPTDTAAVWIGTAGGPAVLCSDDTLAEIELVCDVRSLYLEDESTVWLLTWPQGIIRYQEDFEPVVAPPSLPLILTGGPDGRLHCLTTRAFWRLDGDVWKDILPVPPAAPFRLAYTADGTWWLATDQGLWQQEGARWYVVHLPDSPDQHLVAALVYTGQRLWAGGEQGLWAYDDGAWTAHRWNGDRDDQAVAALAPAEPGGKLWLAGAGGVVRYDPAAGQVDIHWTPSGSLADTDSGLGSARINDLLQIGDQLWIATHAGISRWEIAASNT